MNNETNGNDAENLPTFPYQVPNGFPAWSIDLDPWPDPVSGEGLLDELAAIFANFLVLPKWAPEALALWTVHTYAFQLREITAYLGIESPQKRCGKSTLLTVLSALVNRPVVSSNISPSAFFRVIEEAQPTLLIDEADTLLRGNDELRGILNSGYTRSTAFVVRVASQPGQTPDPDHQAPNHAPSSQPTNTPNATDIPMVPPSSAGFLPRSPRLPSGAAT